MGAPGWELIDTLIVRAVDPSGSPRVGVEVTWAVRQGGGSIAPRADVTDADGYAKAVWTLGGKSGVNQVRARTVEGSQADFESTGEAFRADVVASNISLACGLKAGALWCWGIHSWETTQAPSLSPRWTLESSSPGLVDDSHLFTDLAVTFGRVCALDPSQAVWCAAVNRPAMERQAGLPPIASLASNAAGGGSMFGSRICGLAAGDSTAWCWDVGGSAAQLPGSPAFTRVWMSASMACGLLVDSTAACWGTPPPGDGSTGPSDTAVVVRGGHRFVEMAVGRYFACGRTVPGAVWCWGSVGYPLSEPEVLEPTQLATGASLLGVEWEWIGMYSLGTTLAQWSWGGRSYASPRSPRGWRACPWNPLPATTASPVCISPTNRSTATMTSGTYPPKFPSTDIHRCNRFGRSRP